MRVLFVCTGNTCRSPMAAALFARAARARRLPVEVASAGIHAHEGEPATAEAVLAVRDYGEDLRPHRARRLTAAEVMDSDLVLTMTELHKRRVLEMAPGTAGKVFTLKEYLAGVRREEAEAGKSNPPAWDIADPIGQPLAVYRACAQELHAATLLLAERLAAGRAASGEGRGLRVALGADHGGFRLKEEIKRWLEEMGVEYEDFGTHSLDSVDYPDYARLVAERVAAGDFQRGILVCGTGIGMAIAANKVPGVRAALCHDVFSAQATREHNDSNVLTMGERVIGPGLARAIVEMWLRTAFAGERHARRISKINAIEEYYRGR